MKPRGFTVLVVNTVNCRSQALGLYNFVRGFRWAYKRRGLYPGGGGIIITGIKEALLGVLGIRDNWQNNFRDKG